MFTSQIVKDRSAQHYIISLGNQGHLGLSARPVNFFNTQLSFSFVSKLLVPFGLWQNVAESNSSFNWKNWQSSHPGLSIEHYVAEALVQGSIEVYKSLGPHEMEQNRVKSRFKDGQGRQFQFQPASNLLLELSADKKVIHSEHEASEFLEQFNLSSSELEALQSNLNTPSNENSYSSAITQLDVKEVIVNAIVSGELIISIVPDHKPQKVTQFLEEVAKQIAPAPAPAKKTQSQNAPTRDDGASAAVLMQAAEEGTPFCEECEKSNEKNAA